MTQEEYNKLVERCEKAKIYKKNINRIESCVGSIRENGLRIATTGWDGVSVIGYLSPQLNDRIKQLVIDDEVALDE